MGQHLYYFIIPTLERTRTQFSISNVPQKHWHASWWGHVVVATLCPDVAHTWQNAATLLRAARTQEMFLKILRWNIFCVQDTTFMSATNVARVEKRVSIRQHCTMERSDQCLLVLSRLPCKLCAKKRRSTVSFFWKFRSVLSSFDKSLTRVEQCPVVFGSNIAGSASLRTQTWESKHNPLNVRIELKVMQMPWRLNPTTSSVIV